MNQKKVHKAFIELEKKATTAAARLEGKTALSHYRRLVKHPLCSDLHRIDAANSFARQGELNEARELLKAASQTKQFTDMQCLKLAGAYFATGDYLAANELMLENWQKRASEIFLVPLAETYERLGDYESAMSMVDRITTEHQRTELVKGLIYARQGKLSDALTCFTKVRTTSSIKDPLTLFRAGLEEASCHEKLGDYKQAWNAMTSIREQQFTDKSEVAIFDKTYQKKNELALRDCVEFSQIHPEIASSEACTGPLLLAGHPRSGNSVIAVAMAKELNYVQVDESNAWTRSLEHTRLDQTSLKAIRGTKAQTINDEYYRKIAQHTKACSPLLPHIDKNPGAEQTAARWLLTFPSSRVVFVRRHPLDTMLSCLFTYLKPNPYSLQFNTPERAIASIDNSLAIQDHLLKSAPEHCSTVSYEEFVKTQSLPLEGFAPLSHSQQGVAEKTLNSPNYFQANKPVYTSSVERFKNYLPFIPDLILARFT